jgi:UDP-glucose 4-epimerase
MSDDRVCLITGASGFLGSAIASRLAAAGYQLYGVDILRPTRPEQWAGFYQHRLEEIDLAKLMEGIPLSLICHLAGSASVPVSMENPYADFMALMPGTAKLLSWNGKDGPRARLLFFSSAAVYGNPEKLPVPESCRVQPMSPYGVNKAAGEYLVDAYAKLYGFDAISLRVFSAYGPGLRRQVVWDIANKAWFASRNHMKQIKLHGTGEESRDFIYVDDIASIVLELASCPLRSRSLVVNVGTGGETKIRALAEALIDKLGLDVEVVFSEAPRPGDPVLWCADVSLLHSLGCRSPTSLTEGLGNYAKWLLEEALS